MPSPTLSADRSLYRSRRRYRSAAVGPSVPGGLAPASECCDAVACRPCPAGTVCVWYSDVQRCIRDHPHAVEDEPARYLLATDPGHYPWPYHCVSTDHSWEIYCHSGCWAGNHGVGCVGPGPWGAHETQRPIFRKA